MFPYSNNGEHRIPDGGTCNNESSSNQLGEGPKQLGSRVCMAVQYGVLDASQPRGQKFYTPLPSLTPDMQIWLYCCFPQGRNDEMFVMCQTGFQSIWP